MIDDRHFEFAECAGYYRVERDGCGIYTLYLEKRDDDANLSEEEILRMAKAYHYSS